MGALTAAVATCLTFSPTVFKAIIYPDGETTDSIIKGCSLLLSADDVAQTARAFFLLSAWQWPFVFVNKTLAGVAIGGTEKLVVGCSSPPPRWARAANR